MISLATVSGPLPELALLLAAGLAACALLLPARRSRAMAMLGALLVSPGLLLAEIWHSPQLHVVHHHPLWAAAAAVLALGALLGLAALIVRRPWLSAPMALAALPFRVPIESAGTSANLLVPLYFVIAAAALAEVFRALRPSARAGEGAAARAPKPSPPLVEWLLAGYVVLYAIQASYSVDFEQGLQNTVFFYVPFAVLYVLLRRLPWDRELLGRCLAVLAGLALIFAGIGFVEYATRHLLLNPKLVQDNNLRTYFTVNSVFFDPNIYGRFLALVMILLAAVLLHSRVQRLQLGTTVLLAILWAGLLLTLSRSSLGALLVGLAVLGALRWRVWPVLAAGAAVIVIGLVALAISPKTFGLNQGVNGASSGRANLITGGARMFARRPVWGYGSGAFVREYRRQHPALAAGVSASHTIPVTIAAEQGLIGLLVYLALVLSAFVVLLRATRSDPARAAIAAAFLALVFHTMLYADFLEDPSTWVLLAAGVALALEGQRLRGQAPAAPVAEVPAVPAGGALAGAGPAAAP